MVYFPVSVVQNVAKHALKVPFSRVITRRYFHVGKTTMAITKSSVLAKLRKSTGYSVSNCKKALEMFPDDMKRAEVWLHEEAKSKGWAKWAKIQNRTAAQGLIGVCSQNNVGVMFEVNCETDFVSRNSEFQAVVAKMLYGCMNYAANLNTEKDFTKEVLEESQLSAVKCETSTLGELLIAATCKFNEKTVAKRAVCFKVKNDVSLCSLSHPSAMCPNLIGGTLGKYGALLVTKKNKIDITSDVNSIELNICQHIIGMNPLSVGELTDKDVMKFIEKSSRMESIVDDQLEQNIHLEKVENPGDAPENQEKVENSGDAPENQEKVENSDDAPESQEKVENSDDALESQEVETALKESSETKLLFQTFLLEPNVTVGETLFKSGLEVVAFERFECGESSVEPDVQSEVVHSTG